MDIQKIISELVTKLTGKNDLIQQFTANPADIIKKLTGIDVNADQVKEIVAGVTKALGVSAEGVLKEGSGILNKIKSFFGK